MAENHSERAYRHIRRMLLAGDVVPGARLSYGLIGREIGVSATPVREAVGQLASEGLVELVPQLGAVVRRLTRSEDSVRAAAVRAVIPVPRGRRLCGAPAAPPTPGPGRPPRRGRGIGLAGAQDFAKERGNR
jgi:DNA-binding GntR family transcriptional regulator